MPSLHAFKSIGKFQKLTPAVIIAMAPVPSMKICGSGNVSRQGVAAPLRGGILLRQNVTFTEQSRSSTNSRIRIDHSHPT
ncbi:hypothetical protein BTUL_0166g00030 [Botrytis tulipae]|uniref:Uncharacterized protein n=1 Tax=Botrytis tulipae TaxID=87230 RepID=A0A4Z1EE15_9HELO|nr:hypothetical protein BTUL_0166g00030 [Botrytis tulipae]